MRKLKNNDKGVMGLKLNNKGSALVSVLVVTTFITIIATTMLYMAAMNYQQKQTDYQNKQSFYEAEKALDELKSILVSDVQEAYITAYNETTRQFLVLKNTQARNEYFQDAFIHELSEKWNARKATSGDDLVLMVRSVMTGVYAAEADNIYRVLDYGVYETTTSTGSAKKFALKGVQVKDTVGSYTTFIYTDICMEPPQVDWSDSYTDAGGATAPTERELIAFTDSVYYVNWRKADYDEGITGGYDGIDIGNKVTSP